MKVMHPLIKLLTLAITSATPFCHSSLISEWSKVHINAFYLVTTFSSLDQYKSLA